MTDLDFSVYDALTFDCYGTLIDWESGILSALDSLLGDRSGASADELLEEYGRLEAEAEDGGYRSYRAVLQDVAHAFAKARDLPIAEEDARSFAGSVAVWPAFRDSPSALAALTRRYRLGVVSNVDDDLFALSESRLATNFDEVVTAQQVRSYKPAVAHFEEMERRLDLPRSRILHVAQSLYHDIAPAKSLGYDCVWVNRRAGRPGGGATRPARAVPDLEVPDLVSLAQLIDTQCGL